jgi:ATP diphosphatase
VSNSNWQGRIDGLEQLSGLDKLLEIMSMLRDPIHGCPWDLKQNFASIVPHTIEEAYEVADAIEREDYAELKKELGDLLFQTVFYSQLGKEQQLFDFQQISETMCDKLIRRHPHVFNCTEFADESAVKANWEKEKAKERVESNSANTSALDDIPLALPALSRAYKIQKRASSVGFDWPEITGVIDKIAEEVEEVREELIHPEQSIDRVEDELGDLYFALTNLVRHLGLKPEQVVHQANQKFEARFRLVETLTTEPLSEMNIEQLEALWQQAKTILKTS